MTENLILEGPSRDTASGGQPRQAIVFLHGYGSDGNDLIGLAPYFSESAPDAAFFSPNAPEPCEMGVGHQWFTLQGYDPGMLRRDPERMAGVFAIMYEGAKKAALSLNNYIDKILLDLDIPPDALALIGFSQGTMMALHVALRRTPALGGVIGYSGALLGSDTLEREVVAKPPILLVHGSSDDVVPVTALSHIQKEFDALEIPYSAHIVPNHGHGIEQVGATLGRSFLEEKIAKQNDDRR